MGRGLLEAAGFDPDEPIPTTPQVMVGEALVLYYFTHGQQLPPPGDDYEKQTVLGMVNIDIDDELYQQTYDEIKLEYGA